jgi:hypothetical protein
MVFCSTDGLVLIHTHVGTEYHSTDGLVLFHTHIGTEYHSTDGLVLLSVKQHQAIS